MTVTVSREEPPGTAAQTGTPATSGPGLLPWEDPAQAGLLGSTWWLVARRGHRVVGTWLVPMDESGAAPVARRTVRALPYAAPRLVDRHPRRRREAWLALLRFVKRETAGLELPLAPGFHDYGAVCEVGGFLEARHTHWIDDLQQHREGQLPATRNHLHSARRRVRTKLHGDVASFRFEQAVVGVPPDHVALRRRLAENLARRGRTRIVDATNGGRVVGQALALLSGGWSLLVHSWFDRDCGIRGVPTLLVEELAACSLEEEGVEIVDLEGSILTRVDEFLDGLGARPVPYAVAYWFPDRATLLRRLDAALDIPGRSVP